MSAMYRARVAVVIVALLAAPLAFVARGMVCQSSAGAVMCCPMHAGHSANGKPVVCHCSTKSSDHLPDFGLIAPIVPTTPERFATIDAPGDARALVSSHSQSSLQGFSLAPFEPPRA